MHTSEGDTNILSLVEGGTQISPLFQGLGVGCPILSNTNYQMNSNSTSKAFLERDQLVTDRYKGFERHNIYQNLFGN